MKPKDDIATEIRSTEAISEAIATEQKKTLKAVYKRLQIKKMRKYEARGEEATEMRTQ
jgi:hypothetical protein